MQLEPKHLGSMLEVLFAKTFDVCSWMLSGVPEHWTRGFGFRGCFLHNNTPSPNCTITGPLTLNHLFQRLGFRVV